VPSAFKRLNLTPRPGDTDPLYEAPAWLPDQNLAWVETVLGPQSMQFMIDCLPVIRELLAGWPRDVPAHVVDVGTASGAGANLLGQLYSSQILGPPLVVDAIEVHPWIARYARAKLQFIRHYIVADVMNYWPEEPWDFVICSHTLEHMSEGEPFLAALQRLATRSVLVYTPWKEDPRIPEHALTIDDTFLSRVGAERHWIIESPAWYRGAAQDARCVAFMLPGTADVSVASNGLTC
jgi:hypothetical protein